jgi:hypothetical protein
MTFLFYYYNKVEEHDFEQIFDRIATTKDFEIARGLIIYFLKV